MRLSLAGGDPGVRVPHHGHAGSDDRFIVILVRLFLAGGDPGERDPIMNIPELKKSLILVRLSLQVEIMVCGIPTMEAELKKVPYKFS